MRTSLLLSALASVVAASPIANPAPQLIDINGIEDANTPVPQGPPVGATIQTPTYNVAAADASASANAIADPVVTSASRRRSVDVNAPCAPQPSGSGVVSNPDSPAGFQADQDYSTIALNAPVPVGYTQSFSNLAGSISENGYLGLYTLTKFDTIKCQELCDAAAGCVAINMYIERDPSVNPAAACPNPTSTINFKCTLWGNQVSSTAATNTGQWRTQYQVLIAGSNGYNKIAPPPSYPSFTGPTEFGGAINAPSAYIGMKFFPGGYDPSQCAAACLATTAYDHRHASNGVYDACNFFNSYVISINGIPQGTYCSMYTQTWDKSYSTNYGQYRGSQYYAVSESYGYSLTTPDQGVA
ncbi:hypothetical protein MMC13_004985 [Lambiella insularis]|nr:hypothetical protein [Lambiella insularis]